MRKLKINVEQIKDVVASSATAAIAFALWMLTALVAISNILIYIFLYAFVFIITGYFDLESTLSFLADIAVMYKVFIASSIIATLVYIIEVYVKKLKQKALNKRRK